MHYCNSFRVVLPPNPAPSLSHSLTHSPSPAHAPSPSHSLTHSPAPAPAPASSPSPSLSPFRPSPPPPYPPQLFLVMSITYTSSTHMRTPRLSSSTFPPMIPTHSLDTQVWCAVAASSEPSVVRDPQPQPTNPPTLDHTDRVLHPSPPPELTECVLHPPPSHPAPPIPQAMFRNKTARDECRPNSMMRWVMHTAGAFVARYAAPLSASLG